MPKKILVIDDDVQVRSLLQQYLEGKGFDVILASDGWEGLKQATQHPDLVLLDMNLPKMPGIEVLKRLHDLGDPALTALPVLLVTGFWDHDTVRATQKYGVKEILLKPLDLQDLLKAVQRALKEPTPSAAAAP